MRRFAIRIISAAATLGAVLAPSFSSAKDAPKAHAKDAHEKSLADTLSGPAKDAYVSASLLFRNDDFAGAASKFQQAYDLSSDPRLLYNVALCEKRLRAYARMQVLLQRYVVESGAGLSADQKAVVDDALAAIKNLVGTLALSVSVDGAAVAVDGDNQGTSPLENPLVLDLGKHKLEVKKQGFDVASQEIEITGGTAASLKVALVKEVLTGRILVTAEPDTTISVDGEVVGKERLDRRFPAGTHEVVVTNTGKLPFRVDVDLHERETKTFDVTLVSEAHDGAPIWPWVVGGVAVAAGAAVGGYFLFKPDDKTTPVPGAAFGTVKIGAFGGR